MSAFLSERFKMMHQQLAVTLNIEDFRELNLFTYSVKKNKISIDDISDEEGWKLVRANLLKNIGINSIPRVYVSDISSNGDLILKS